MNITEEQSREAFAQWVNHSLTFENLPAFRDCWESAIRFAQGHLTTPPKITSVVKDQL